MPVDLNDLPKQSTTFKEIIDRTSLANLVAGFLIMAGMAFFMWTENSDVVKDLALLGTGWLLKEVNNRV